MGRHGHSFQGDIASLSKVQEAAEQVCDRGQETHDGPQDTKGDDNAHAEVDTRGGVSSELPKDAA